jgi:hypothetical protein
VAGEPAAFAEPAGELADTLAAAGEVERPHLLDAPTTPAMARTEQTALVKRVLANRRFISVMVTVRA